MFSTLIKQLNDDNEADTWAKAYNNRGHAKYMAVDFDEALQDYESALKTGWKQIWNLYKLMGAFINYNYSNPLNYINCF